MLRPSPADLLMGVADALAATVLPELEVGPAREQVQAAIGITRRVARALPHLASYLLEDNADLAATLRRLLGAAPQTSVDAGDQLTTSVLVTAEAMPPLLPALDDLAAVNLQLREALARYSDGPALLDERSHELLQMLLGRMTAREAALRLSPWER
jgi:hypothetical protein